MKNCEPTLTFVVIVWLLSIIGSCHDDTNAVTLSDVISTVREKFILLIFRDDLIPVRVKATSCTKQVTPCEVEWKWMDKHTADEFSYQTKLQLRSNISTLIDYFIIFWLNRAGGLNWVPYELNTTDIKPSEPITLLKMLTDLALIDSVGRVFDNATILAAQFAISQNFNELARCFVSVQHRPRFWEPGWTPMEMEKKLGSIVIAYWLETAVRLVKDDARLNVEYELKILETELQMEENSAERSSDWEMPSVTESIYARRYLQLTVELEIKDYLLSDSMEVKLGKANPVGRFRFRHITDETMIQALEKLIK